MSVEEKVFGLQIAVDDILSMQILQSQSHFCCIELGDWVRETLVLSAKGQ